MRISTSQIFSAGALGIQRNQQGLFTLQNQLSTGRRVLTPADDPVAAAQALIVTQSKDMVGQYVDNQSNARAQLGVLEGNLSTMSNMMLAISERVQDARNPIYSDTERGFIAQELQNRLNELISLGNSDDGSGQFLFSGYQGATRPFALSGAAPVAPATQSPVAYAGDDGERLLQVSSSRQLPVNVSGAKVFMDIRSGNGTFETAVGGNSGGGINQGTATIDAGSVLNPGEWSAAVNTHGSFRIEFSSGGGLEYQIYNAANVAMLAAPASFTPGQAIVLEKTTAPAASFGAQVVVSGTPAAGDQFIIEPSTNQSLFQTLQDLIGALQTPVNATFTRTELENRLNEGKANLDRAFENLGRIRADIGSRQKELDFLTEGSEDLDLQYATTLSALQDLDYTEAISRFTQQQMQLEAAQKSFVQISGLSLFSIL